MPIKIELSALTNVASPLDGDKMLISYGVSGAARLLALQSNPAIAMDADGNKYRITVVVIDGVATYAEPELIP